ncbi:Eukaryotic aspartyl protease [Aphelenchoides besseyi]|nr:Eukaryotic aspartyl protease [Aphelenchoides besseyi]
MSSILVFGLLIASVLVTLVDAGSWSVDVQAVKRVQRNTTLKLSDVYGQALAYDSGEMYRGTVYVGTPPVPFTVVRPYVKHCSSGLGLYDPDNSDTAEHTYIPFYKRYRTGTARGYIYKDYLTFGGSMRFTNPIALGAADVMTFSDQAILGLPSKIDPREDGSSVMHEAWRQELLDAPIFTVYMRKCPDYEADCVPGGNLEGLRSFYSRLIDSGTNAITAPARVVEQIMNEIGARAITGGHMIQCDADTMVTLTIDDHPYKIPSKNMLSNLHNGWCLVLLISSEGPWILGTPFTESFCQIHNIENRTLGFAKSRN